MVSGNSLLRLDFNHLIPSFILNIPGTHMPGTVLGTWYTIVVKTDTIPVLSSLKSSL